MMRSGQAGLGISGRGVVALTLALGLLAPLAARLPFEDYKLERFLVLNDLRPGERLQPGLRVKSIGE